MNFDTTQPSKRLNKCHSEIMNTNVPKNLTINNLIYRLCLKDSSLKASKRRTEVCLLSFILMNIDMFNTKRPKINAKSRKENRHAKRYVNCSRIQFSKF